MVVYIGREHLGHIGIASLEGKFQDERGGCCKWEFRLLPCVSLRSIDSCVYFILDMAL